MPGVVLAGASVLDMVANNGLGLGAGTFKSIGVGLASIFILIAIFYSLTAILEGGKFQFKMLIPLFIYLCVANFSMVATPVMSVFKAIQGGCNEKASSAVDSVTGGKNTLSRMKDAYISERYGSVASLDEYINKIKKEENDEAKADYNSDEELSKNKMAQLFDGIKLGAKLTIGGIDRQVAKGITKYMMKEYQKIGMSDGNAAQDSLYWGIFISEKGFFALLAVILQWIATLMSNVMKIFGNVLVAIIISFGPITWAFAIIPGNGKFITSWFLRICQFALYSPVVCLIQVFMAKTSVGIAAAMGAAGAAVAGTTSLAVNGSVMTASATLLCEIIILCSVPTICSMIIEGASGQVSFSQGAQMVGAAAAAPVTLYSRFMSLKGSKSNVAEQTRDDQHLEVLREISNKLGGGGSNEEAAHGNNSMKS